jgi:hypothetical protein
MDDWMLVDVIHGSHDAILELLFGCNSDVAQDGARKLGKEAFNFNQVQPRAMLGSEGKFEAARRLFGEPGFRLLGDVRGIFAVTQQYYGLAQPGSPAPSATAQSTSASPHPHR